MTNKTLLNSDGRQYRAAISPTLNISKPDEPTDTEKPDKVVKKARTSKRQVNDTYEIATSEPWDDQDVEVTAEKRKSKQTSKSVRSKAVSQTHESAAATYGFKKTAANPLKLIKKTPAKSKISHKSVDLEDVDERSAADVFEFTDSETSDEDDVSDYEKARRGRAQPKSAKRKRQAGDISDDGILRAKKKSRASLHSPTKPIKTRGRRAKPQSNMDASLAHSKKAARKKLLSTPDHSTPATKPRATPRDGELVVNNALAKKPALIDFGPSGPNNQGISPSQPFPAPTGSALLPAQEDAGMMGEVPTEPAVTTQIREESPADLEDPFEDVGPADRGLPASPEIQSKVTVDAAAIDAAPVIDRTAVVITAESPTIDATLMHVTTVAELTAETEESRARKSSTSTEVIPTQMIRDVVASIQGELATDRVQRPDEQFLQEESPASPKITTPAVLDDVTDKPRHNSSPVKVRPAKVQELSFSPRNRGSKSRKALSSLVQGYTENNEGSSRSGFDKELQKLIESSKVPVTLMDEDQSLTLVEMHDSESVHISIAANEGETDTEKPDERQSETNNEGLTHEQAEEIEWHRGIAEVSTVQETLHRISQDLVRSLVDSSTALTGLADAFRSDGLTLIAALDRSHVQQYHDIVPRLEKAGDRYRKRYNAVIAAQDRELQAIDAANPHAAWEATSQRFKSQHRELVKLINSYS